MKHGDVEHSDWFVLCLPSGELAQLRTRLPELLTIR